MKLIIDNSLTTNDEFRDDLHKLLKKYGYDFTWVSTTEAELYNIGNVETID